MAAHRGAPARRTSVEARDELLALLRERSFEQRREILASGRESDLCLDCQQTVLTAQGHMLVGRLMLEALDQLPRCEAVAGVAPGGCPLASAVSLYSVLAGRPLPALYVYVHSAAQDHGSGRLIEGDRSLRPQIPVVLLEDVIATGDATIRAAEALRRAGADIAGVVVIVDRLEGGAEALAGAGIELISLFTRHDFIADCYLEQTLGD